MNKNHNDDLYNLMLRDYMNKTGNDMFTLFTVEHILKQDYLSYKAKVLAIKSTIEKNRNRYEKRHTTD
jgi:hypothetical protein